MKHYLGIDIGGTAVKLGIVNEAGAVLAKAEESVSFDGYRTPILTTVLKAAQAFLAAQSVPAESLAGIGVSATGQIDSRKGIVAGTCGNLPNYIGAPIKAELEKTFGLPVTVANDANCMTLGEVWVGGAQGYTDVIGVTLVVLILAALAAVFIITKGPSPAARAEFVRRTADSGLAFVTKLFVPGDEIEAILAGDEDAAPSESETPDESAAPETSEAPAESAEPDTSEAPAESAEPSENAGETSGEGE